MDHHQRHNPPHHHHHLHPQSTRYAPLPPQHHPHPPHPGTVFLPPDPYRRQPHLPYPPHPLASGLPPSRAAVPAVHHHDRRVDNGGSVLYISYAPPPVHTADDRGRLLVPVDLPERLIHRPPPHPLVPALKVSERIIFPDGHPEASRMHQQHRPRRPEAFLRQGFGRERGRLFDQGQVEVPFGRREGEAIELVEQEEASSRLGGLGRKRHRWDEARALKDDSMLEDFVEGRDSKRLVPAAGTSRHRGDVGYDLRADDGESSRVSAHVLPSERDQAKPAFPRPPAEMPGRSSPLYSVSRLELLGKSPMSESETIPLGTSHRFREENFVGAGKRYAFEGEDEVHAPPRKPPQQKPSVLSRIQFAKPFYKRKHEQETVSPTSRPVSQTSAFSEGRRIGKDTPVKLDVSFKTDGFAAKEMLPSSVSASSRSVVEVCGRSPSGKNVAKDTKDTTASPTKSFLMNDREVTDAHTHKLKIREERFAHLNAGWKSSKERTSKMSHRVSATSNSAEWNFDSKVVGRRTPKSKVKNEAVPPNLVQISVDGAPPVKMTGKKMAEKIVVPPHASLQGRGRRITPSKNPKRKHAKEISVPENNATANNKDSTQKTPGLSTSAGVITTERCPNGKLTRDLLTRTSDAEPCNSGTFCSNGSDGSKLAKDVLVTQTSDLIHQNRAVISVNGPTKEVSDDGSFPSVLRSVNIKDDPINGRCNEKPDKDTLPSPSSELNSGKKTTMVRTLKKKIIKRIKSKKKFVPVTPLLSSMDSPEKISKDCVSTTGSVWGLKTSSEVQFSATDRCTPSDPKDSKEEKMSMKHLKAVQEVSTSGFSCQELKEFDKCTQSVAGCSEVISHGTVSLLTKKVAQESSIGDFTLMPCMLGSCPLQEISAIPLHFEEAQRNSFPNHVQECVGCSHGVHRDEVHRKMLDTGLFNSEHVVNSGQRVGHLGNIHGDPKVTASIDLSFQDEVEGKHFLNTCHSDSTNPVLLGKAENSGASNLGLNNSDVDCHLEKRLGLDISNPDPHLQKNLSRKHFESNTIDAPSGSMLTVVVETDMNKSPLCSLSIDRPANKFKSSAKQDESKGCNSLFPGEESRNGKHSTAAGAETLSLWIGCRNGMTIIDGKNSNKAGAANCNRNGEILPPSRQYSAVLEELEAGYQKRGADPVMHSSRGRLISLKAETQIAFPNLENQIKQEASPAEEVTFTENRLTAGDYKNNIEGGDGSIELHVDAFSLPIKSEDVAMISNLTRDTVGQQSGALLLQSADLFLHPSLSGVGDGCSAHNSVPEKVASVVLSSSFNVYEGSCQVLATVSEEMHLTEVNQTVSIPDIKSCDSTDLHIKPSMDPNNKNGYSSDSTTLSGAEHEMNGNLYLVNLSDKKQGGQVQDKQFGRSLQLNRKEKLTIGKVCQQPEVSKMHLNQKIPSTRLLKKPPSPSLRHNKWYRTENASVSSLSEQAKRSGHRSFPRHSPRKLGKIQSSYIRKGNSLIRKSVPAITSSQPRVEQTSTDQIHLFDTNKNMSAGKNIPSADTFKFSVTRIVNNSLERPKTPALPLSNMSTHPLLDTLHSSLENPLSESHEEGTMVPLSGTLSFDVNEKSNILPAEESKVLGRKKLMYVKHGSNQIVAAPVVGVNSASACITEEGPALPFVPSENYYRNKNKLIREISSLDGQGRQDVSLSNSNSSGNNLESKISLKEGAKVSRKTRLERAMEKTSKHSSFSLVWTLNGPNSQSRKHFNMLKHQAVLPYLFPWKRTYRRDFVTKMGSKHSSTSVSFSSKFQLFRQRRTIYTVSKSGYSLRKSGVVGVSGRNLKWSKSMEKRSRKANEVATVAKVERERKKKKLKGTENADLPLKRKNCSQRERIFRVGNSHYKMDSSRRTLVRIPVEKSPSIPSTQAACGAKMSIVPRRLSIGNDEYVRVGNGNQLVRDPKKLVRILANEKIRWSLHTARLRSVRKQQYCQFFTRFGKCNKEDGKCPYIHDPTKIAICTKFLKGLCSSPDCKLTHKVIPERMPDCSFFLQGLCTNMSCPYRHVKVNAKASVCEGFLKGYCIDGDECRKKHSYVCPNFEATGKCLQRVACKLHHPKSVNKQPERTRKRKRTPGHDHHGRGRYFGGGSVAEAGESRASASSRDAVQEDGDIFCREGRFVEYIGLDLCADDSDGDDNGAERDDRMDSSRTMFMDFDLPGSKSSDADDLIKRILVSSS